MPWQTCNTMELKRDFVELASREGANMRQLCGRFGISPPTGYKWLARYLAGEGLEELSRKPASSPSRTKAEIEALIVAARQQHPAWGGRKLKRWLENRGMKEREVALIPPNWLRARQGKQIWKAA